MKLVRWFFLFTPLLFVGIAVAGWLKHATFRDVSPIPSSPVEIALEESVAVPPLPHQNDGNKEDHSIPPEKNSDFSSPSEAPVPLPRELPSGNELSAVFQKNAKRFPFIETLVYHRSVPWKAGKSAWLVDYAKHYETSRYFIARSLKGNRNYLAQDVREGEQFNVYKKGYPIEFHLLVDLSHCLMWLYVHEIEQDRFTFLARYPVGVGRKDANKVSGTLTPVGIYSLGKRTAIYTKDDFDYFNGQKTRMIEVFGSHWIPFEKEISNCSEGAKGECGRSFGLHGLPWRQEGEEWKEDQQSLQHYESDGCIRLTDEDVRELFALITSKRAVIEIASHAHQSQLYQKIHSNSMDDVSEEKK